MIRPSPVVFKDDGVVPNSRYALLLSELWVLTRTAGNGIC